MQYLLLVSIIFGFFTISAVYGQPDISVEEWGIQTPNSSPHDVVVANDGTVWFTEIGANKIGSFDPKTEQFQEWKIPTPNSRPHGLAVDSQGSVWFPNYNNNKIGVIITGTDVQQKSVNLAEKLEVKETKEPTKSIAAKDPPLKQIDAGIKPSKVTCTEGLELVLKASTGDPACVKPTSVSKLIDRGWAIHVLPEYKKSEQNNSVIFEIGNLDVTTMDAKYYQQTTGYLAKPSDEGTYPAVVMIHEWWGLNDNIKEMAEKLASHGYVVLAVDLYNGQVATTSQEARKLIGSFDQADGIENMNAAVSFLQKNYNPEKIGSIGWCFGGGQSLNLALNNDHLDATVMYYGSPVTDPDELSSITWPLLGIFAEKDSGIPPEKVAQFETALEEAGVENEITIYPGVDHAFANPSGDRYSPDASKDAWQKTLQFFDTNLMS